MLASQIDSVGSVYSNRYLLGCNASYNTSGSSESLVVVSDVRYLNSVVDFKFVVTCLTMFCCDGCWLPVLLRLICNKLLLIRGLDDQLIELGR